MDGSTPGACSRLKWDSYQRVHLYTRAMEAACTACSPSDFLPCQLPENMADKVDGCPFAADNFSHTYGIASGQHTSLRSCPSGGVEHHHSVLHPV